MALTLVNSYYVEAATAGTAALVTESFTPAAGELLVVKIVCADADQTIGTLAVTGFTLVSAFASRVNVGNTGASCRTAIFTAFVNTSALGTVSSGTFVNTQHRAMVVERWSGAQLAATPATASFIADATAPWNTTITTAANNSVVSYVMADWTATADPNSVAYVGDTATPTAEHAPTSIASGFLAWWLYQAAASAGSQTWGISAPTGISVTAAAIELQDSGGGSNNWTVTQDDNRGLTDALSVEYTPGPGTMIWTKSVEVG